MLGSIKHFDRKKYIDIIEFPKILFCLFLNLQRTNTSCTKLSFRVQSWMLIRRLFSFEVMQIIQGQKQQCIYKHAKLKWSHKSSLKNYKKKAVQGHFQRLCADKLNMMIKKEKKSRVRSNLALFWKRKKVSFKQREVAETLNNLFTSFDHAEQRSS